MFKTIYVVHGESGLYPDTRAQWLVAAFTTPEAAEAHRVAAQETADAQYNQLEAQGQYPFWEAAATRFDLNCVFIQSSARYWVEPLHLVEGELPSNGFFAAPELGAEKRAGINKPAVGSFGDKLAKALGR